MTDEEDPRRAAIRLLRAGEPLPYSLRDLLFPVRHEECRLEYAAKEPEEQVLANTMAVPLQPEAMFGYGPEDWHNMLIFGENLQILKELNRRKLAGELRNADGTTGVRLVYIDPPFGTNKDFVSSHARPAYQDRIAGAEFLEYIRKRLVLLKSLLSENGSIYVHLDEKNSHYVKVIMDEVFGPQCFQREIVWRIGWVSGYKTQAKNWIRNHDVILYYSKSSTPLFNKVIVPYPEGYVRRDGKPPAGKGIPLEDTWNASSNDVLNSIQIMSFSREKTGYPTQKNENLLERIIRASSDPGDIVLDAFCGSGTACVVAEKTGRRWIGIDAGRLAIYTTQRRILETRTGEAARDSASAFCQYNAGLYDYAKLDRLCWDDWRFFALKLFGCVERHHVIGGIELQGKKDGGSVLVYNHKTRSARIDEGTILELHRVLRGKIGSNFFIIAPRDVFDFQQDYVQMENIRYYALRIPYSFIRELHRHDFKSLQQPVAEEHVNALLDAVGFDFNSPPKTEWSVTRRTDGDLLIRLVHFQSTAKLLRKAAPAGFEGLSTVAIDANYSGDTFLPTVFLLRAELEALAYQIQIPSVDGQGVVLAAIDVFGNESRVVWSLANIETRTAASDDSCSTRRGAAKKSSAAKKKPSAAKKKPSAAKKKPSAAKKKPSAAKKKPSAAKKKPSATKSHKH